MELRWIGLIALWTLLSGPIFGGASGAKSARLVGKPARVATNHAKKISPRNLMSGELRASQNGR
jgi:hypothetical protein